MLNPWRGKWTRPHRNTGAAHPGLWRANRPCTGRWVHGTSPSSRTQTKAAPSRQETGASNCYSPGGTGGLAPPICLFWEQQQSHLSSSKPLQPFNFIRPSHHSQGVPVGPFPASCQAGTSCISLTLPQLMSRVGKSSCIFSIILKGRDEHPQPHCCHSATSVYVVLAFFHFSLPHRQAPCMP